MATRRVRTKTYLTNTLHARGIDRDDVNRAMAKLAQPGKTHTVINDDGFVFERFITKIRKITVWILIISDADGVAAYVGLPSDFPGTRKL
jgi:hypothetical protein